MTKKEIKHVKENAKHLNLCCEHELTDIYESYKTLNFFQKESMFYFLIVKYIFLSLGIKIEDFDEIFNHYTEILRG